MISSQQGMVSYVGVSGAAALATGLGVMGLMGRDNDSRNALKNNLWPVAIFPAGIGLQSGALVALTCLMEIKSPVLHNAALGVSALAGAGAAYGAHNLWFHSSESHPSQSGNLLVTGLLAAPVGLAVLALAGRGAMAFETAIARRTRQNMMPDAHAIQSALGRSVPAPLRSYQEFTRTLVNAAIVDANPLLLRNAQTRVDAVTTLVHHELPEFVPADLQTLRDDIDQSIETAVRSITPYRDGTEIELSAITEIQSKIDLLKLQLGTEERP
jgi:hypothetical protein